MKHIKYTFLIITSSMFIFAGNLFANISSEEYLAPYVFMDVEPDYSNVEYLEPYVFMQVEPDYSNVEYLEPYVFMQVEPDYSDVEHLEPYVFEGGTPTVIAPSATLANPLNALKDGLSKFKLPKF